jgi:hypothetical protein
MRRNQDARALPAPLEGAGLSLAPPLSFASHAFEIRSLATIGGAMADPTPDIPASENENASWRTFVL